MFNRNTEPPIFGYSVELSNVVRVNYPDPVTHTRTQYHTHFAILQPGKQLTPTGNNYLPNNTKMGDLEYGHDYSLELTLNFTNADR